MPILFYSHTKGPYVAFSNFSPHSFELDGAVWPTVEHYFQAAKFPGTEHAEAIRLARTPTLAKRLGRSRAVHQKFASHPDLRQLLLETGDEDLIEDAPRDYYWGRGARGTGKNRLGVILMDVRSALRENG